MNWDRQAFLFHRCIVKNLPMQWREMCLDTEMRNKMGVIAQKRVERYYTHEISMNQYRELYKEVIM